MDTLTQLRYTLSMLGAPTHTHLLENKRLLVPHRVDGVGRGAPLGAIFLLGVSRQTDHLHLDARLHTLVGQKLSGVDLARQQFLMAYIHELINSMKVYFCVDPRI